MTKLNNQCKLLKTSPATMKQKIHMIDFVILASIAYEFYTIAYSLPTINKLDKTLICPQKSICSLPKSAPNVIIQLPHSMFGLEAFSLKNAYLRCIGKNLWDALNDTNRLGIMYQGFTNYILQKMAKHKIFLKSPNKHAFDLLLPKHVFFLKHIVGIHIKNN